MMRMRIIFCVTVFYAISLHAEFRTWTDKWGVTLHAELCGFSTDHKFAIFKTGKGKLIGVNVLSLSPGFKLVKELKGDFGLGRYDKSDDTWVLKDRVGVKGSGQASEATENHAYGKDQITAAINLYRRVCEDCSEELSMSRDYVPVTRDYSSSGNVKIQVTRDEPVGKAHYYVGAREITKEEYDKIYNMRVSDFNLVIEMLEPLAKAGNVDAQDRLGYVYWHVPKGVTVTDWFENAYKWSKLAGGAGSVDGAERCALMWLDKNTKGTRADRVDQAIDWYEITADNLISCGRVSEVYKYADHVHKLGAPYRAKAIAEKADKAKRENRKIKGK